MDLVAYVDKVDSVFMDIDMDVSIRQFWQARVSFLFGWTNSNGYWSDNRENSDRY